MRVDELGELGREVLRWEDEEGHCAFEVSEEGGICGGAGGKVCGCEFESGGY